MRRRRTRVRRRDTGIATGTYGRPRPTTSMRREAIDLVIVTEIDGESADVPDGTADASSPLFAMRRR